MLESREQAQESGRKEKRRWVNLVLLILAVVVLSGLGIALWSNRQDLKEAMHELQAEPAPSPPSKVGNLTQEDVKLMKDLYGFVKSPEEKPAPPKEEPPAKEQNP